MSLINQMLKDLESRSASHRGESAGILRGLSGANTVNSRQGKMLVSVMIVLAVMVAGFYVWKQGSYEHVPYAYAQNLSEFPISKVIAREQIKENKPKQNKNTDHIKSLYDSGAQSLLNVELKQATNEKIEETAVQSVPSVPVKTEQKNIPAEVIKKDKPMSRADLAEKSYRYAVDQLKDGYFSLALQSLEGSLNHDRRHVAARDLLANLLVRNQRMDEAIVVLSEGMEIYPYQQDFIQLYARLLAEKGLVEPALEALERISPDLNAHADYHALRATLYQQSGRYKNAINIYQDVLRIKPDKGRWWMGLALSLESTGNRLTALKAYRNAVLTTDLNYRMKTFAEQKIRALERG